MFPGEYPSSSNRHLETLPRPPLPRHALYLFCIYNVTKHKERTGKHLKMDKPFILHREYSPIISQNKMSYRFKIALARKVRRKENQNIYFIIKERKTKIQKTV